MISHLPRYPTSSVDGSVLLVLHSESGYKAFLMRSGQIIYFRRFSNQAGTYVECGGPL